MLANDWQELILWLQAHGFIIRKVDRDLGEIVLRLPLESVNEAHRSSK